MVLVELDAWVDEMRTGFAPYYENVKVYKASECLAKYKGRDKNGEL